MHDRVFGSIAARKAREMVHRKTKKNVLLGICSHHHLLHLPRSNDRRALTDDGVAVESQRGQKSALGCRRRCRCRRRRRACDVGAHHRHTIAQHQRQQRRQSMTARSSLLHEIKQCCYFVDRFFFSLWEWKGKKEKKKKKKTNTKYSYQERTGT